jgi:predicted DNA-binding transcriptional regulator YafY
VARPLVRRRPRRRPRRPAGLPHVAHRRDGEPVGPRARSCRRRAPTCARWWAHGVDEPRTTARVSLRPGAGWELRREATATADDPDAEGWTVVDVGFADPERFADRVTGYGADAVVLSPDEARDAVVRRLRGLAS